MRKSLFDQIVQRLMPHVSDDSSRKALVNQALIGSPVLETVDWQGSARDFTVQLITILEAFGDVEPGRPALIVLLEQLESAVGENHKREIDTLIGELVGSIPSRELGTDPINPYKGLQAFTEIDTAFFFGRETFINQMLSHLTDTLETDRLLAVIGASGSGKSSVVMAGFLPRLQQGGLPQSETWHILERLVPGERPLEALADNLVRANVGNLVDIEAYLKDSNARGLYRIIEGIKSPRVVLFVDQFEEVFSQARSEEERRQFLNLLTTAVKEPNGKLIVVLTLRADFYDRPLNYAEFGTLLSTHNIAVVPMSQHDLYTVVQKPATAVGLAFEEGLVSEIVADVRDQMGALPLLQFTLEQLYDQRQGHRLTRRAYQNTGGVQGALKRHAEAVYDALPTEKHRQLTQALFLRLVEPGATQFEALRRRASLSELILPDVERSAIYRDVLDRFVRGRLLTTDRIGDIETIEVSHEALIREWPLIGQWLQNKRDDMRLQKALTVDIIEWRRRGQPNDMLYRGTKLEEAQHWLDKNEASVDEKAFIEQSIASLRRSKRIQFWIAVVFVFLIVFGCASTVTGILVTNQSITAQTQAALANKTLASVRPTLTTVNDLIVTAAFEGTSVALDVMDSQALFYTNLSQQQLAEGSPHNALLLALESLKNYPIVFHTESAKALTDALYNPLQEIFYGAHDASVSGAVWNHDESKLLSWSNTIGGGGTVHVWDIGTKQELFRLPHDVSVSGAVWSRDGSKILSWSHTGRMVYIWDTNTGKEVHRLLHNANVSGAMWNRHGTQILSWTDATTVHVWDANTGREVHRLLHNANVSGAMWNRHGTQILSWANNSEDNGAIHVWDVNTGREVDYLMHDARVYGAMWSQDETMILSRTGDATIRVWDLATGKEVIRLAHGSAVYEAIWSRDGTKILSWSNDGTIYVWDVDNGHEVLRLPQSSAVYETTWNQDETKILSWSDDSTVRVWNTSTGEEVLRLPHGSAVYGAIWSRDGTKILSWSDDGIVHVWAVETGEEVLRLHDAGVSRAIWNQDETRILSWSFTEKTIRVWDTHPKNYQHDGSISRAIWNQDGTKFLSWSDDGTIRVWDAATGKEMLRLLHGSAVSGAVWYKDGTKIRSWSDDGTIRVWDAATGKEMLRLLHDSAVSSSIWNQDGTKILSWTDDNTIYMWNSETGEEMLRLPHASTVYGATWNQDEIKILSWSEDGMVRVWAVETGEEMLRLPHASTVYGATWNQDETKILSWSEDGTVRVWAVETGEEVLRLDDAGVSRAIWSTDETKILSRPGDGTIRVWDAATGEEMLRLLHGSAVYGAIWSTDGTKILSWSDDRTIRLWNTSTGEEVLQLRHDSAVYGAIWNQDETKILSWSDDGTVRVWNTSTGEEVLRFLHGTSVHLAIWNQDETKILSWSSTERTTHVWVGSVEEAIKIAKARILHSLSREEREQFFLPTLNQ